MKELCLDFINTRWYITHELNKEILTDPELLMEFFHKRQLARGALPEGETVERLLHMRAFLAVVLENFLNSGSLSEAAIAQVNQCLAMAPCIRTVHHKDDGICLRFQPILDDWSWIMAEIAASFAELIEYGDRTRIRMCGNPECKWFFYDASKSSTKRWCDNRCASLMKVRRFRAKQKMEHNG